MRLASGETVAADVVVADVDAAHLYADLLPDRSGQRRVRAAGRSTSGFVLLLGAEGRTEALDHHTVLFSSAYRQEFRDLAAGRPPADPTVYVCAADRNDPSAAPPAHESLFVLVNVPSADDPDAAWADGRADAYADRVLAALDRRSLGLRPRLVHREVITPADLAARHRGRRRHLRHLQQRAPGRLHLPVQPGPPPRPVPRRRLHPPRRRPPLVALSAKIVAAMVDADGVVPG